MKKNVLVFFISLISFNSVFAQDTFKAMFYNLLNFPLQTIPANRIDHLEVILAEAQPDLLDTHPLCACLCLINRRGILHSASRGGRGC